MLFASCCRVTHTVTPSHIPCPQLGWYEVCNIWSNWSQNECSWRTHALRARIGKTLYEMVMLKYVQSLCESQCEYNLESGHSSSFHFENAFSATLAARGSAVFGRVKRTSSVNMVIVASMVFTFCTYVTVTLVSSIRRGQSYLRRLTVQRLIQCGNGLTLLIDRWRSKDGKPDSWVWEDAIWLQNPTASHLST